MITASQSIVAQQSIEAAQTITVAGITSGTVIPPGDTFRILTEAGDVITTESGDPIATQ